jgi:hypothetical protein
MRIAGVPGLVLLAGALTAPREAQADESAATCLAAHQDAQTQRIAGSLKAARESLLECGDPACPAVLQEDCARWLEEVEQSMPTVVIDARDRAGRDLVRVKVLCDGQPCASELDGKAIDIDPGVRRLRFELEVPAGSSPAPPIERELVIREGEKNRRVVVRFEYPPLPPPAIERPVPAVAIVLGAAGVVGLGAGAVAFGVARSQESELESRGCAPACAPDDADAIDRADTIALVSAGVGAAALAAATVVFLMRPSVTVGLTPEPGGGRAALRARF